MTMEEVYSDTRKLITKYRIVLTWWTFVREIPRLMISNMDVIYELLTYSDMPLCVVIEHVTPMKESLEKFINLCIGIQNDLEELEGKNAMIIKYHPHESLHKILTRIQVIEDSTRRQRRLNWIIPTFIFYHHGLGVGFEEKITLRCTRGFLD
ncbi:hypothetical protein CEXT_583901 [Caerostris extrusa]|uniref:Uncharacterized protein n=1 Tax=Caerostris extrusa TaxID=172846 RepID=A0AAV4RW73_CAEEX|nr:hypothetical protein CEXT_583901 [Caerostris extrusa]